MLLNRKFKWLSHKQESDIKNIKNLVSTIAEEKNITYFIEPFSGGVSTAVKITPILVKYGVKNVIVNNVSLIVSNTFNYIINNVEDIFEEYWKYEKELTNIVNSNSNHSIEDLRIKMRDYYENKRIIFNKNVYDSSLEHCALFLFLVNRSLNLIYAVNSKEEYVAPFSGDVYLFSKQSRRKTFLEYHYALCNFNVIFEKMNHFNFIDKYKNYHKEAIFYFDPDNFDKVLDYSFKLNFENSIIQFYKILENLIINKNNHNNLSEEFIVNNKFKTNNNFIFKF